MEEMMEKRFLKAAQEFLKKGKKPGNLHPFPSADDRDAYNGIPQELKMELIAQGEDCLGFDFPALRATDFMAFKRTGNRSDFESLYFKRRYALNSLTAAECVEDKGRFLEDIINGVFALCEESAWQLPAHNSYIRNAPQDILPDITRPVLDLFACETGAQLACIRYLLGSRLDAVSPNITGRIAYELERRIFKPYLEEHFWWMGKDEEPMCNWTPWCTQNVLLAFFLQGCPADVGRAVIQKASESLDYFLKDYGDDGCCDEGAQYYRHAGLCLDGAAALLNQVTEGAFSHLYQWEKIKNIASYILNVHVEDRYFINFADCSPVAGRAGVREFLFGKRTGQPDLMLFAAKDFKASLKYIFADESNRLNLFYRLQTIFHYKEVMSYDTERPLSHRDIFYSSVGLFLARSDALCLAVKAGDNDDSHNHNDTGSITLYKNGTPLFVDIGVESYTKKTFSPDRYEIWTMQSGYHNLPTLDGLDQKDGADYCARNVNTFFDDGEAGISMELAGAYPLICADRTYTREVRLKKQENTVLLTDRTDSGNVILNFITYEKPELTNTEPMTPESADSAQAAPKGEILIGSLARAAFTGASLIAIETLPITDSRLRTAWDHELYRIRLSMTGGEFKMKIQ